MIRTDYIGAITYTRRKHVRTHGALSGFTYESIYSNLWITCLMTNVLLRNRGVNWVWSPTL